MNKPNTTDTWLEELFNRTINAKQAAVETAQIADEFGDTEMILNRSNALLDRYRVEFNRDITNRIHQERIEELKRLPVSTSALGYEIAIEDRIVELKATLEGSES